MPSWKPWWLLSDEQARKNRPKTSATTRPVPPGVVVACPGPPRPLVYTLPNPWPPYVPPQEASEFNPDIRKRKRAHKKQVSASQIVDEIEGLVTTGLSLKKARSQIAKKYKKRPSVVERMDQRAKKQARR